MGTKIDDNPSTNVRAKTTGDWRSNLLIILLNIKRPRTEPEEHQKPIQRLNYTLSIL